MFLLQNDELEYETKTQTKSTWSETFYTAFSDLNWPVHNDHAKTSEVLNLAEKPSNMRVFTFDELKEATKKFCRDSEIGDGGFGTVYKGVIKSLEHPFDEIQVAVKLANGLLSVLNCSSSQPLPRWMFVREEIRVFV
ncbi:putative non-specific serine/threonine protein kinase [Helianthus anomalus]